MIKLKRYLMKCIYDCDEGTHVAVPRIRQEGEWVKYEDIKDHIRAPANTPQLPSHDTMVEQLMRHGCEKWQAEEFVGWLEEQFKTAPENTDAPVIPALKTDMNIVQSYEANLYWRCSCGYENNNLWFYEGNSSYIFKCSGCGLNSKVLPPEDNVVENSDTVKLPGESNENHL